MNTTTDRTFVAGWQVTDIVDTRSFDLVGDAWKPVPGSGDAVPCACCGTRVVIHVHVRRGAERAVLGQTCAKRAAGTVERAAKQMPARRSCPVIGGLIEAGEDRAEAVRIVARLRAGATPFKAIHPALTVEAWQRLATTNPAFRVRSERLQALIA